MVFYEALRLYLSLSSFKNMIFEYDFKISRRRKS